MGKWMSQKEMYDKKSWADRSGTDFVPKSVFEKNVKLGYEENLLTEAEDIGFGLNA